MPDEPYEGEHVCMVEAMDDGYEVACSCGWDHPDNFDDVEAAEDAWDNHCDVVFMEATADDRDSALASAITGRSDDFSFLDDEADRA